MATPVDPTTRSIVPMPANNEQPVVKLPQSADSVHPEPLPFNDDQPLDIVVQPSGSETPPTESVDPERPQSSLSGSLDAVAHPLPPAGQSQTPSNEPLNVVR